MHRHNTKFWVRRLIWLTRIHYPTNVCAISSKWYQGKGLQEPRTPGRQAHLWTRPHNHSYHASQRKMASKVFRSTLRKTTKSLFSLDQRDNLLVPQWTAAPTAIPFTPYWAFTFLNSADPQEAHKPSGSPLKLSTQHSCQELKMKNYFVRFPAIQQVTLKASGRDPQARSNWIPFMGSGSCHTSPSLPQAASCLGLFLPNPDPSLFTQPKC